jgi:hypothetical protein
MYFETGDKLTIGAVHRVRGQGLDYDAFIGTALESGNTDGLDVYDVQNNQTGQVESVYGYSIHKVGRTKCKR